MVSLLIVIFVLSLMIALGASAWFTRCLEVLSDHFRFSPGLLSLLGALGANIPNYIAALTAAISGQLGVGIGIIIGSNIYNIAIILGISTFASPTGRGIVLTRKEARDADLVGRVALVMMLTTALAVGAPGMERCASRLKFGTVAGKPRCVCFQCTDAWIVRRSFLPRTPTRARGTLAGREESGIFP